mmetsp:Transcript_15550/g.52499  ORF Transcript_15550/g.52499 Transcript_15550/m.52499 type:complete len:202 (-) Transcript_15550:489-1094(-)
MPIVPAFAKRGDSDQEVFRGIGFWVVGSVAVEVRCRVHEPGEVKDCHVAHKAGDEQALPVGISPSCADKGRHSKTPKHAPPRMRPALQLADELRAYVTHVNLLARLNYGLVFLQVKPAHMGKEEAAKGVVGICHGLGVQMVHAMVTYPMVDSALIRNGVCNHGDEAEGSFGLVRAVRPKPMGATGDAKARDGNQDEGPTEG